MKQLVAALIAHERTPAADDGYPQARHEYEMALHNLIQNTTNDSSPAAATC